MKFRLQGLESKNDVKKTKYCNADDDGTFFSAFHGTILLKEQDVFNKHGFYTRHMDSTALMLTKKRKDCKILQLFDKKSREK